VIKNVPKSDRIRVGRSRILTTVFKEKKGGKDIFDALEIKFRKK
jgi:hypothetical protein